jgi:hypothetical protein
MPAAIAAPPFLILDNSGTGSIDLTGVTLDAPTSPRWNLIGMTSALAPPVLADPHPYLFEFDATRGPQHDMACLDRIHVIPRRRDFGAVLTDQELEVEVWNAFMARARILEDLTIEGPAGIEVDNPLGLPTHFPASESKLYTVRALADGDPLIDNLVTWVFVGIPIIGTNLKLTGFRLIPFAFEADFGGAQGKAGIEQEYGYLTDVLTAYDGDEQRIQLREVPIGTIALSAVFTEPQEAQEANAMLYGSQARPFGVPLWQWRTPLISPVVIDDSTVAVDTQYIPFKVGGLVFLWRDSRTWEAQRIESVAPGLITTTLPLRKNWAVPGTWVMPMVFGRLSPDEGFTWHSRDIGGVRLVFQIEGYTP